MDKNMNVIFSYCDSCVFQLYYVGMLAKNQRLRGFFFSHFLFNCFGEKLLLIFPCFFVRNRTQIYNPIYFLHNAKINIFPV